MPRKKQKSDRRERVGNVSLYQHHGAWYLYYREAGRAKRHRIGSDFAAAKQAAAEVNAKLSSGLQSPYSFQAITVDELRRKFLDHHEHVEQSSFATLKRYRSATNHLALFAGTKLAHALEAEDFLRHLRTARVSPNGHRNTRKRPLKGKGILFILETCRSMYKYAAKKRHLPPYSENPFEEVCFSKSKINDRRPISIFDADLEIKFFESIALPQLPFFAVLAKTGARSGELRHATIEEFDLTNGWWHIRNKPELGWWIKTRRERSVPLAPDVVEILKLVIGSRKKGLVFWHQFQKEPSRLAHLNLHDLSKEAQAQALTIERQQQLPLSRGQQAKHYEKIWRAAGIVRQESVRITMMRTTAAIGHEHITCPKSWRHTFACLLQEANVDPLIRQITLGHMPVAAETSVLGMTGVYTHTRPELQHREILRALTLRPETTRLVKERLKLPSA